MRPTRILAPLIFVFLAYILSLAWLSNPGFPKNMQSGLAYPYLADKPVGEDGYYMLTVAWNIARGDGVVYNNAMPTVGIQPLSTLIFALLAGCVQLFGGDQWTFIRVLIVFGSINLLVFGHIIAILVRNLAGIEMKDFAYALGFVGAVFNFALFRWFTYGLETGIYMTLLAVCILYSLNLARRGERSWGRREALVLGILGGLTAWARIDFGIVFFVFLTASFLRGQIKLRWALVTGIVAAWIISPWFLYNFAITGSWLPSSGVAQAALITTQSAPERWLAMAAAFLSHLTPWVYSNTGGVFLWVAGLSLIVFWGAVFRKKSDFEFLTSFLKQQPQLTAWSLGFLGLILIYPVFFWATHFYQRYSAPILIPIIVIMAKIIIEKMRRLPALVRWAVLSVLPVCFFGWSFLSLHTGKIGNPHVVTAGFVQTHFSSVKVGAFQSGVIGYFNPHVINLDGKVNHIALNGARDQKLDLYIESEKIDVLVDWPNYIYGALDPTWLATYWERCKVQIPNGVSICLQRKRMPSP
jgi:hypothetical protein